MGKQAWVAMLKWVAENQSMAAEDVKPGLEAVEAPAAAAAPESCEPPAKKEQGQVRGRGVEVFEIIVQRTSDPGPNVMSKLIVEAV